MGQIAGGHGRGIRRRRKRSGRGRRSSRRNKIDWPLPLWLLRLLWEVE